MMLRFQWDSLRRGDRALVHIGRVVRPGRFAVHTDPHTDEAEPWCCKDIALP
jgi:hypothetical protein